MKQVIATIGSQFRNESENAKNQALSAPWILIDTKTCMQFSLLLFVFHFWILSIVITGNFLPFVFTFTPWKYPFVHLNEIRLFAILFLLVSGAFFVLVSYVFTKVTSKLWEWIAQKRLGRKAPQTNVPLEIIRKSIFNLNLIASTIRVLALGPLVLTVSTSGVSALLSIKTIVFLFGLSILWAQYFGISRLVAFHYRVSMSYSLILAANFPVLVIDAFVILCFSNRRFSEHIVRTLGF